MRGVLTGAEVDEEGAVEVSVVDEGRVLPGAAGVLEGEVTQLATPPKHIVRLLVDQKLLRGGGAEREGGGGGVSGPGTCSDSDGRGGRPVTRCLP